MSGNIFKDTKPITQQIHSLTLDKLSSIMPSGLHLYPFGSAGKKSMSLDMDFFVESTELKTLFNTINDQESKKQLKLYFESKHIEVKLSGISLHIKFPVYLDYFIQIDFMIVNNAEMLSKLHDHTYNSDTDNGKLIVSLWSELAKLKNPNFKISPYRGLVDRTTDQLITNDRDQIAKLILSESAAGTDISSVNAILNNSNSLQRDLINKVFHI